PLTVTVHRDPAGPPRENAEITYRIDVVNNTAADYPAASISQMLPGGMRAVTVDSDGVARDGEIEWTAHLSPHATLERTLVAIVGSRDQIQSGQFIHVIQPHHTTATGGSEFSTTACVRPDPAARPLACGSDFATLQHPDHGTWLPWLGTAAAALATTAGFLAVRGRKRRGTPHSR
ncbi:hypothetical protein KGQ19_37200, partial [Catenulispora sp. NL8]